MSNLTLISTLWLLIGAALVVGTPVDQTDQLRVNVKVSTGSKAVEPIQLKPRKGEQSFFDQKLEEWEILLTMPELADKELGNPVVESDVKELVEEAKKKPELMKRLQGFVQDVQKKMLKKRNIVGLIMLIIEAIKRKG